MSKRWLSLSATTEAIVINTIHLFMVCHHPIVNGAGFYAGCGIIVLLQEMFEGIFHVTLPRPSSYTRSKMHCRVAVACGQR